jgi:endonuclease/exonuclease/phosphatase family metal-dependent hydrolase
MDNEFTSSGLKHWSYSRFQTKLNHLSKTLLAIGGWEPPPIVGLCEVENRYVLDKLIWQTPLKKFNYRFIHHDSPDSRGIDVILLYRPEKFTVLSSTYFEVHFPFDTGAQTREILMVKGKVLLNDTIILFVNHWPSRRGGYSESQPRRIFVAGFLRSKIDSVFRSDQHPNIIIMGDFNDEPDKESLARVLNALPVNTDREPADLVNLMYSEEIRWDEGTIKYQGQWSIFDQFIVSGNLVSISDETQPILAEAHIFKGNFLTEKDDRNLGDKLKRTYAGPRYLGGFSDHLPIYLDLKKN